MNLGSWSGQFRNLNFMITAILVRTKWCWAAPGTARAVHGSTCDEPGPLSGACLSQVDTWLASQTHAERVPCARLAVSGVARPCRKAGAVFEEILGIPAHPLIIHGAVVFVPLQIAAAIAYALVPYVRRYTAWLVVGLAVVAPAAAYAAKLSGEALRNRLSRNGTTDPGILNKITKHSQFADRAAFASIALGVLMLVLVWLVSRSRRPGASDGASDGDQPATSGVARGPTWLTIVLTVAVLGIGATTGYYIFRAGDSGAHIVWEGI